MAAALMLVSCWGWTLDLQHACKYSSPEPGAQPGISYRILDTACRLTQMLLTDYGPADPLVLIFVDWFLSDLCSWVPSACAHILAVTCTQ